MKKTKRCPYQNKPFSGVADPSPPYQQKFPEVTLESLLPREEGWISELPDHPLMPFLGLRPGKPVEMVTRQKFGGPLVVKMNGRCVALSRALARQVKLKKAFASSAVVEPDA